MHNWFLVYFVNLYKFRAYICPLSGGTTACIQHFVLVGLTIQPWKQSVIQYVPDVVYIRLTFMNPCTVIYKQLRKQPIRCKFTGYFIIPSQLYIFRAMFSPIVRSTWLCLQHLVVFTNVVAGWCHVWVGTVVRNSSMTPAGSYIGEYYQIL